MWVKLISLTCAVCGIAIVSVSCAYAAVNVADNGAVRAAKSPESKVETIVAQAWWDAAYNATSRSAAGAHSAGGAFGSQRKSQLPPLLPLTASLV